MKCEIHSPVPCAAVRPLTTRVTHHDTGVARCPVTDPTLQPVGHRGTRGALKLQTRLQRDARDGGGADVVLGGDGTRAVRTPAVILEPGPNRTDVLGAVRVGHLGTGLARHLRPVE